MSGTVSNHDALQVPVQGCCGLLTGAVRNEMMLSGACAGRTGLLIACYLVYNNRMSATEAVHYVRSRRLVSSFSSFSQSFLIKTGENW